MEILFLLLLILSFLIFKTENRVTDVKSDAALRSIKNAMEPAVCFQSCIRKKTFVFRDYFRNMVL